MSCTFLPDNDKNKACCQAHDDDYTRLKEQRLASDIRLRKCFEDKGYKRLSRVVYVAVRIFGRFFV